jgi:hypothetical protein
MLLAYKWSLYRDFAIIIFMSTLKRIGLFFGGSVLSFVIVSVYVLTSSRAVMMFWSANVMLLISLALYLSLISRASLISLRLGILSKWNRAETSNISSAFLALTIESTVYIFSSVALAIIIGEARITDLVVLSSGPILVPCGLYYIGRSISLSAISEVTLGQWLIPITGRFHGVIQVPSIVLHWKKDDRLAVFQRALEKTLGYSVLASPIGVLLFFAFAARILA